MNTDLEPNNTGLDLVRKFHAAGERLRMARASENNARVDLSNAETVLVRWLVPKDAKIGEVYCLAVGDGFMDVHVVQSDARSVESSERSNEKRYVVGWRNGHVPRGVL